VRLVVSTEHCENHSFETAEDHCGHCGRPYCSECTVSPWGPKKPPLCKPCAIAMAGIRKHDYGKPLSTMRDYLERMESALYLGPQPKEPAPVLLAALREKMLGLAATAARGAHPYFVPPEHTARARRIMGPEAWLCPEQMVLRERDPAKARAVARANMKIYLGLPNYQNNLKWLGYRDADFADGGSDRLVDAIVAWGDDDVIAERIRAHHEAGADHVCIQPFRPDGQPGPDLELLETFAPARQ